MLCDLTVFFTSFFMLVFMLNSVVSVRLFKSLGNFIDPNFSSLPVSSHVFSVLFTSVAQSCPTLRPHGLQHARLPCPSPAPRAYSVMSIELVMPY